jgi:NAD+ kinase
MTRTALLVTHTGRKDSTEHARTVAGLLIEAGFTVRVMADEASEVDIDGAVPVHGDGAAADAEIVFALGGDGTLLRAAELARPAGAPLLGINLGRVGFLAEAELHDLHTAVRRAVAREYTVEERFTIDVSIVHNDEVVARSWALNEASVERGARSRLLEVRVDVDGRRLSRYGCDGVICATPTGSTAYAYSAGGPVVWPGVDALLLVPISAHSLFNRALVVAPSSTITITVDPLGPAPVLFCDGRRAFDVPPGGVIMVTRGDPPVYLARLEPAPFTDRLVAKFDLPVEGWR